MNEALLSGRENFLSIKEVVGRTKYTRDYIAKLAREGAIVGVQVGRQWLIDEASLARFTELTALELTIRNRQLSGERRRERELKRILKEQFIVAANNSRYSLVRAVVLVLVVVGVGGVTSYAALRTPPLLVSYVASLKAQAPLTQTLTTGVAIDQLAIVEDTSIVLAEGGQRVVFENSREVRPLGTLTEGLLLLPATGTLATEAEVTALFSDPVTITYTTETSGTVITAQLNATSAVSVRFVAVPVLTNGQRAGSNRDLP